MKKILRAILETILGEKLYMKLWKSTVQRLQNKKRERAIQEKNEACLVEYLNRFKPNIFIETGTYRGDMVNRMLKRFKKIYSIELSEKLHEAAVNRFRQYPHVTILQGDSSEVLPTLLEKITEPALFWLDAHYSTGETVRADIDTPIEAELKTIFNHPIKNHVILIDDAREFVGSNDYPTAETIEKLTLQNGYFFKKQGDTFILYPHQ